MARFLPALRPVAVLALVVLLASFAWVFFATPPRLEAVDGGLIFAPNQIERRFGMMVVYLVIGAAAGLAWGGWALGTMGQVFGPAIVPVYVVLLTGAAAATERLGVVLGPSDPREADLQIGQTAPDVLALESPVFWLVWPVAGLLALVVVLYWRAEPLHADEREVTEPGP